jgi:hypothetical protein
MCNLLKRGGHLREMMVNFSHVEYGPGKRFHTLLKPFERLRGLKLAVVERHVTQAYGVRLKIMEGEAEGTDR